MSTTLSVMGVPQSDYFDNQDSIVVGGVWKNIESIYICIGNVWYDVSERDIVISSSWKT